MIVVMIMGVTMVTAVVVTVFMTMVMRVMVLLISCNSHQRRPAYSRLRTSRPTAGAASCSCSRLSWLSASQLIGPPGVCSAPENACSEKYSSKACSASSAGTAHSPVCAAKLLGEYAGSNACGT